MTFVSNFTDVDDKIIKAAKEESITERELTDKYIKAYEDVRRDLNLKFPTFAPRVTETMTYQTEYLHQSFSIKQNQLNFLFYHFHPHVHSLQQLNPQL